MGQPKNKTSNSEPAKYYKTTERQKQLPLHPPYFKTFAFSNKWCGSKNGAEQLNLHGTRRRWEPNLEYRGGGGGGEEDRGGSFVFDRTSAVHCSRQNTERRLTRQRVLPASAHLTHSFELFSSTDTSVWARQKAEGRTPAAFYTKTRLASSEPC